VYVPITLNDAIEQCGNLQINQIKARIASVIPTAPLRENAMSRQTIAWRAIG
jgi:hypothetical protein